MDAASVIGRDVELTTVGSFLTAISRGTVALELSGDAGIGKTALWSDTRRRAQAAGARVLWCRPAETAAKLSFAGIADLLAPVPDAAFAVLPEPQAAALEVAMLRARPRRHVALHRAVAASLLTLLRELSSSSPLLLAIDDWQWLDVPSRGALEFAARRLEGERVGLLYTLRTSAKRSGLRGIVPDERLTRVALTGLPLAALGEVVSRQFGQRLPRPVLARVAESTAGNPFHTLEIARMLLQRNGDGVYRNELPVPEDVRELIAGRIKRLPAITREQLELAAVLSAPTEALLEIGAFAPAEDAGIVRVGSGGRIEFAHPLLAATVSTSLSTSARRRVHGRAAALVVDREQQARHLALAAACPDAEVAGLLDEAAELAELRGAPDTAAELAELAARSTPTDASDMCAARLVRAAGLHFVVGDLNHAETLLERALSGEHGDPVTALALQLRGQLAGRRSDQAGASADAAAALELAGEDHSLRARLRTDLAYAAVSGGDFGAAAEHAQIAVLDATAAGEDSVQASALAVLTMVEFLGGNGVDEARLRRALALEDVSQTHTVLMRPTVIHGMLQLWTGAIDDAIETLGAVHAELVERGQEGVAPLLFLYLAWAHVWRGQIGPAAELARQAAEAAALLDDPAVTALALTTGALVHAHAGETELARADAESALAVFERLAWRSGVIWPLWALGIAALGEDDPATVDRLLGPLAEQLSVMGAGDPVLGMFMPDEIEALVALGDLERARTLLTPFQQQAERLDRAWAMAAATRCQAAIAAAGGDFAAASDALSAALLNHARCEMPFERARTLLLAGQIWRRAKQRRKAADALSESEALFMQVGSPRWAQRAHSELMRAGSRTTTDDELTESERRIAELAAAGLTNREVAERAFVSVKTVEAGLTRAYRKLGVRSRVGLANALRART